MQIFFPKLPETVVKICYKSQKALSKIMKLITKWGEKTESKGITFSVMLVCYDRKTFDASHWIPPQKTQTHLVDLDLLISAYIIVWNCKSCSDLILYSFTFFFYFYLFGESILIWHLKLWLLLLQSCRTCKAAILQVYTDLETEFSTNLHCGCFYCYEKNQPWLILTCITDTKQVSSFLQTEKKIQVNSEN